MVETMLAATLTEVVRWWLWKEILGIMVVKLKALLQTSIQASINNQFQGGDVDETSEFAMDTNTDIRLIEPSLPSTSAKDHTKSSQKTSKPTQKMAAKPKKPKLHVMMRFFRYRPSKILKQSSFSLNSSALGSVLNRQRDDSSGDEDRDGSEGRKKKKKKKLLYFKSKHKNIIDPAFVAELGTLESSMEGMTISEKTYIRVKPGEVPLPSIFKLTIIDVKKKKKDRLVLEPPVVLDKAKKVKARKDSKEREPAMPELVKEKAKAVRKKSQSDDNHPPSLEIQVARDQCLPPKKRHRMMFAAETTGAPAATQNAGGNSDKSAPGETKDGTKSRDASATPVSSPTRPAQKGQKQRHRSVESASGKDKAHFPIVRIV
nr:hypothetical protein BaRGS_033768 [Batillaria attramentaria]